MSTYVLLRGGLLGVLGLLLGKLSLALGDKVLLHSALSLVVLGALTSVRIYTVLCELVSDLALWVEIPLRRRAETENVRRGAARRTMIAVREAMSCLRGVRVWGDERIAASKRVEKCHACIFTLTHGRPRGAPLDGRSGSAAGSNDH